MSKIVLTLVLSHTGGRPQLVVSSANSTNITLGTSLKPGLANGNMDGDFGRLRKRFEFAVAGGGGTGTSKLNLVMNTTKILPNATWMTGIKLPSIPAIRSRKYNSKSRRSESARPSRRGEERPRPGRRPSSVDRIENRPQEERGHLHRRSGSRDKYHEEEERVRRGESERFQKMYKLDGEKSNEGRKRVEWRYGFGADEDGYTESGTLQSSSSLDSEGGRSRKTLEDVGHTGRVEGRHSREYENDHDRRRHKDRARFDDKYIGERPYKRDHGREHRWRRDRKSEGHYAGAYVADHREYDGAYAGGIDGGDGGFAGAN